MGLAASRAAGAISFVALLSLTACSSSGGYDVDDISEPGTPSAVIIVSGNNQTAVAGAELPNALVGTLRDVQGHAVANRFVQFVVVSGGGSVAVADVRSDANGRVENRWTLGTGAGLQKVEVRGGESGSGPLVFATFEATATAGAGVTATAVAGTDGQAARKSTALSEPVGVSVVDINGNAKAGVLVTFTPCETCGSVTPATAVTNAGGIATSSWTLGATTGKQRLSASSAGLPDVAFEAFATRDVLAPPANVIALQGDAQTVQQHGRNAQALRVFVTDARGAGLPGIAVDFTPAADSTYVAAQTINTDAAGYADFTGYFHEAGTTRIEAAVSGLASIGFDVVVAASAFDFDGDYDCRSADQPQTPYTLRVAQNSIEGVPLTDGTFTLAADDSIHRPALSGEISIDAQGDATAQGTVLAAGLATHAAWSCERL